MATAVEPPTPGSKLYLRNSAGASVERAPDPSSDSDSSEPQFFPPKSRPDPSGPSLLIYAVVIILVVAVVAGAVYFSTGGFHRSSTGSTGTILIANQTQWSIPITQFNGVAFITQDNGTVNGTLYESAGLEIYTMTPTQYAKYAKTDIVPGYEYTSGLIANDSLYEIGIDITVGQWYLVFSDPFSNITYANTLVAFYTNVVLTSR